MSLSFDQLTEIERACLRLVYRGLSSKQIAAERGVRSDSIDRIILTARHKLGGITRREAARLLVEYENAEQHTNRAPLQDTLPDDLDTQSQGAPRSGLPDSLPVMTSEPVEPPGGRSDRRTGPWTANRHGVIRWATIRQFLSGSSGSLRNDLTIFSSVAAITVCAAGAACLAVALISLLGVLDTYAFGR